MFKALLAALFLILTPVSALAAQCPGSDTTESFFAYVKKNKFVVYILRPSAQERFSAYVNAIRTKNGVKTFSATAKFYFADIAVNTTGVVWMENGCVVAGSVLQLPSAELAKVMTLAGLKPEDMVKYEIGENI